MRPKRHMSTSKTTLLEGSSATDPRSEPSTAGPTPPTTSASDELISILLVDDEPRNLTVLQSVLEDSGYRLVCAESAEQALCAGCRGVRSACDRYPDAGDERF